ncbi:MAG: hypothetical protein ACK53L_23225, partial [Pirellulaceae bacterium]
DCAASSVAGRFWAHQKCIEIFRGYVRFEPTIRPIFVSLHRSMFDSFRCVPPGSQRGNSNVAQWELSRKTISELMGESDIEADHYMQRGQASCRRG